jgi:hypothetical protein
MYCLCAPYDEWFADIHDDCDDANLVVYNSGGDGTAKFRVFVDEAPGAELSIDAQSRLQSTGRASLLVGVHPDNAVAALTLVAIDSNGCRYAQPRRTFADMARSGRSNSGLRRRPA